MVKSKAGGVGRVRRCEDIFWVWCGSVWRGRGGKEGEVFLSQMLGFGVGGGWKRFTGRCVKRDKGEVGKISFLRLVFTCYL